VYYLPSLSNILQVGKKNNMIYFQPFSIARIEVQNTSILSNFISNAHTHFFLKITLLVTSNLESYKGMIHNPPPQIINKEPNKDIHHTRVEPLSF
jgi:hypothetical protein